MYAEGDGVPHDDLKAFEFFSKIADENADEGPEAPNAGVVASAFTALGRYSSTGSRVPTSARTSSAPTTCSTTRRPTTGDPNAQYNLARLYLDGTGVTQDPRQAARWFNLAAEKGHPAAQALLGQLLINGQGVTVQRARGLAWLTLARDAADGPKDQWIVTLQEQAMAAATERDRAEAQSQVDGFYRRSAKGR